MRSVLLLGGLLCLLAGFLPTHAGSSPGTTNETRIGLPFSPLYRSVRGVTRSAPPATTSGDARVEPSWAVTTTYSWEVHILSGSTALALLGAGLLVAGVRLRSKHPRAEEGR